MAIDTTLLEALIAVTPSPGGYWSDALLEELLDNLDDLESQIGSAGITAVVTDATLTGDGTATAALSVAVPLPAVTTADNTLVLTVVSGAWTAQAPASGLPAIVSSSDTLVLTVVSGATTATWTAGTPGPTGDTGPAGADGGFDSVQGIVTVTADKTLALTDAGDLLKVTASAEITIPLNSSIAFDVGQHIDIMAYTASNVDIIATGGVTLRAPYGARLKTQYGTATLVKIAADEWLLVGDCEAIV